MKYKLLDFDSLMELSKTNPQSLDKIKQEAAESLIEDAPTAYQQRLRGLQFQINMELRRSKSPMAGCMKISQMMQDSLSRLRYTFNEAIREPTLHTVAKASKLETAEIIPFHQYS